MTPGRFISFEGGEGAGKSTQVAMLVEALRGRGLAVVATREPGGSPSAEAIRHLLLHRPDVQWEPLSEVLLHYAARFEHVAAVVRPSLAAGTWVVSDRFADSTMAYQGFGLGVDRAVIAALDRLVLGGFRPDVTVILDLPAEDCLRRASARGHADRYERMDIAFHRRLRVGFLAIAAGEPGRCVVIDADMPAKDVHAAVLAAIDQRLPTVL